MRAVAFGLAVVLLQTSAPQTAPPKILTRVLPRYFASGALDPVLTPEGSLEVELALDDRGAIQSARVSKPMPDHQEFDAETLRALKTWRFEPARKDGVSVASLVHVTIEFTTGRGGSRGGGPVGRAMVRPKLSIQDADDDFTKGAYQEGEPGLTLPRQMGTPPEPKYTTAAKARKVQGTVELEGIVLPDGTMGPVRIVLPLDPDLDAESIRVAKLWKFSPGQKDGRPVPVVVRLELEFRLH